MEDHIQDQLEALKDKNVVEEIVSGCEAIGNEKVNTINLPIALRPANRVSLLLSSRISTIWRPEKPIGI